MSTGRGVLGFPIIGLAFDAGQRGRVDEPLEGEELLLESSAHRRGVVLGLGEVERLTEEGDGTMNLDRPVARPIESRFISTAGCKNEQGRRWCMNLTHR